MRKKDLLEKPYDALNEIVFYLYYQSEPVKKSKLTDLFDLSLPTLNDYLQILKELVYEEHLEKNIRIVQKGDLISLEKTDDFPMKRVTDLFLDQSIKYHMILNLYEEDTLDWNFFQEEYSISSATYYRRINELNGLLAEFNIAIKRGRLVGDEKQIRYFYYSFFWFLFENKTSFSKQTANQYINLIELLQTKLDVLFDDTEVLQIKLWMKVTFKRHNRNKSQLSDNSLDNLDRPMFKEIDGAFKAYMKNNDRFYSLQESQIFYDFFCSLRNFSPNSSFANRLAAMQRSEESYLWHMVKLTMRYLKQIGVIHSSYPETKMRYIENLTFQFYSQLYYFDGYIQDFESDYDNDQRQIYPVPIHSELVKKVSQFCGKEFGCQLGLKFESSLATLNFFIILNQLTELSDDKVKIGVTHSLSPFLTGIVIELVTKYLGQRYPVRIEAFNNDTYYDLVVSNTYDADIVDNGEYFYAYYNHTNPYDLRKIREIVDKIAKEHTMMQTALGEISSIKKD